MRLKLLILILLIGFVSAELTCAQQPADPTVTEEALGDDFDQEFFDDFDEDDETSLISDPFERLNRGTFWFNDKVYFYLLKPVARGYRVVPRPARKSVGNFFSNLSSPVRIVNSVLQLKLADAGRETTRLFVNTTIGLGGLIDAADRWGKLPRKDEDFGQTLGVYHVGQGPYLVLPFLGPSSLRDTGGLAVDTFFDPLTYLGRNWSRIDWAALKTGLVLNHLSLDDDSYEKIKRDSLDPYLFMRAAYAQYRVAKVAQ